MTSVADALTVVGNTRKCITSLLMPNVQVSTGYTPHPFQLQIHHALKRFSVIVAHRRFGKTILAINQLVDGALRCPLPDPRFAYLAPLRTQAKGIAWDYLKRYATPIPGTVVSEAELFVQFPNGGRVRLYGADNPDALKGLYLDGVVPDEVAQMRSSVWGEVLRPLLTDRHGWALFIGTPKGINLFSELYYKALQDEEWYAGMFRASATGLISEEELAHAKADMSESQYRQEFECDFNASTDDTLISLDVALASTRRTITASMIQGSAVVLGVDVARHGGDRTVIFRRQGLMTFPPGVWRGLDNMEVVTRVANVIATEKPDAVFIDAGRGEGVIDRLRQLGHEITEVNFGGKPLNPAKYVNRKGEMWATMADWLKSGGCIPNMPDLIADLCGPTYSYANAANKFELESKDDLRERGLKSPDLADALALTFAIPVPPRDREGEVDPAQSAEYDPFG